MCVVVVVIIVVIVVVGVVLIVDVAVAVVVLGRFPGMDLNSRVFANSMRIQLRGNFKNLSDKMSRHQTENFVSKQQRTNERTVKPKPRLKRLTSIIKN